MNFFKRYKIKLLILGIVYVAFYIVAFYGPKGYQLIAPGQIQSAEGTVIKIVKDENGETTTRPEGSLNTVAVFVQQKPSLFLHFLSKFDKKVEIEKISNSITNDENMEYSKYLFAQAVNNSLVEAYEAAKLVKSEISITYTSRAELFLAFSKGANPNVPYPRYINTYNGEAISSSRELSDAIKEYAKDQTSCEKNVSIQLEDSSGNEETKEIKGAWINSSCKYGLAIADKIEITNSTPKYEVNIPSNTGGNSGGLMQTLNLYMKLTGEDLTKGRKIVGTGTIELGGNVGPIGGSYQKFYTAHYNNADMFIVLNDVDSDTGNFEGVHKAKTELQSGMQILRVKTFQEALDGLRG